GDDHLRAAFGQPPRHRGADAAAAAGHHRDARGPADAGPFGLCRRLWFSLYIMRMPFRTPVNVRFNDVHKAAIVCYPRFLDFFHASFFSARSATWSASSSVRRVLPLAIRSTSWVSGVISVILISPLAAAFSSSE